MKSLPLFGQGVTGESAIITAQRRVNCLYEMREDGDKQQIIIRGTPGTILFSDQSAILGGVRGMHTFVANSRLYVVITNQLLEIDQNGVATNRGAITAGTNIVAMEDNGSGHQLLILDGAKGWIFNTQTNVLTQIANANFPQNAITCSFDSGYFLVDDPTNIGRFWKSAAFDGTSWSATDFGTFSTSSNQLIRVFALAGAVILFGSLALEFWQNVGGSGFPYSVLKQSASPYGLAARWSIAPVEDTIAFLGQNQQGQVSVFMLQGYTPARISTPDLDFIINQFSTTSDAVAMGYVDDGHIVYQITFPTAGRTFIYDNTTKLWGEAQTGVGLIGRHYCNLGVGFNGNFYCGDFQAGRVYQLSSIAYTDNGSTIPRILQTRHVYQDYNILGIDELFLDLETGVGLQSGQGSLPQIMMQVSKDNGRTFGIERWKPFGAVGQYKDHRAIWRRLGSGRDFVFKFQMTDPVKFVLSGGGIVPRLGTDNQNQGG
jgi:hypothetical protein